ncbi:hypothetical protein FM042_06515 [Aliidiomarina halalkaliphila]|uniref:MSHA biogenesis protein MshI n=1 Tax=Aliidiomarina halalkaliphila TaxID=2593535 RepID=A0A552X7B0_9GAMM|nr:hypothetical protein [Aliidiomarina halalkaliphila]TRW50473.1 hypothetical protein FM042_06515 [Aliidiomarina halalkaliphila]
MLNWFSHKKRRLLVSFGICENTVQMAVMKADDESGSALEFEQQHFSLVVNDEQEIVEGDVPTAIDALLSKYKRLDFKHQWVQLVVSEPHVELVSVERPDVPDADVAAALQWTLRDLVSMPPADLITDYYDIPIQVSGSRKINVVAASRALLTSWVDVLTRHGLVVQGIVTDALALTLWTEPDQKLMLLNQHKGQRANLHIIVHQQLVLSRRLQQSFDLPNLNAADMTLLEDLAIELQRSQDFFSSQLRQAALAHIEFAFGHDKVETIAEVISAQLGMQVGMLSYPAWAKELGANDYSDLAALSGLLWLVNHAVPKEKRGAA